MKKIISLVITLSLVITMFASVTAFAVDELTPLEWNQSKAITFTKGTTSTFTYTAKDAKLESAGGTIPDATKYVVDTINFKFASDATFNYMNIFGGWTIYANAAMKAGVTYTIDIVYSIDDDDTYMFLDGMFKGAILDDRLGTTSYRNNRTYHNFNLSATPSDMTGERKAYGSDFSFKALGLYGGTATYDNSTGTYTLTRNIGRVRKGGQSNDLIGCADSAKNLIDGVYIAGYDNNGKLLFVNQTRYYASYYNPNDGKIINNQCGIAGDITSAATEKATKIKLYIYDEWSMPVGSFSPAIEALEYKIINE